MFKSDKPQQDRAYNEMLQPVKEALAGRTAEDLAVNAGAQATDDGRLLIRTLGEQIAVKIPDGELEPALENWHALVLLHYIINADGTRPTGRWMSFGDMKDGLIRGTKFATTSDRWFSQFLKGKPVEEVGKACEAIGGMPTEGRGDVNVLLPFLPNFPALLSLWEADEDFAASGKLLLDSSADHYLSIEDAVTVGEILHKRIEDAWTQLRKAK